MTRKLSSKKELLAELHRQQVKIGDLQKRARLLGKLARAVMDRANRFWSAQIRARKRYQWAEYKRQIGDSTS